MKDNERQRRKCFKKNVVSSFGFGGAQSREDIKNNQSIVKLTVVFMIHHTYATSTRQHTNASDAEMIFKSQGICQV